MTFVEWMIVLFLVCPLVVGMVVLLCGLLFLKDYEAIEEANNGTV